MKLEGEGTLLRIYIGESDRWRHQPLYEAIVLRAREAGLAGATVLRGPIGFGANSLVHTSKVLRLSEDLPMVIEIADREEAIRGFLPILDEMVGEGLITLQQVHIVAYRHRKKDAR
jgi:PII-like signaling protein